MRLRNIKGAESYIVTDDGRIYSQVTDRWMEGGIDSDGYHIVTLRSADVKPTQKVHRLVAEAFMPNPDNKPEVNHKDGNKTNNHYSNLEWVTTKENCNHRTILKGSATSRPVKQIDKETGEVVMTYPSMLRAKEYGFDHSQISKVCRGKLKQHKGYKWEFVNP